MKAKISKSRLKEIIESEVENAYSEGILNRPIQNRPMIGVSEEIDQLKLEKWNKALQETEEKEKTFYEMLKRDKFNLREFQSLLKHLRQDRKWL